MKECKRKEEINKRQRQCEDKEEAVVDKRNRKHLEMKKEMNDKQNTIKMRMREVDEDTKEQRTKEWQGEKKLIINTRMKG